jgi:hypothetical protein
MPPRVALARINEGFSTDSSEPHATRVVPSRDATPMPAPCSSRPVRNARLRAARRRPRRPRPLPRRPAAGSSSVNDAAVVKDFADGLDRSPDLAVAVAAIRALTGVIKKSGAQTMMGLEKELKDAAAALQR